MIAPPRRKHYLTLQGRVPESTMPSSGPRRPLNVGVKWTNAVVHWKPLFRVDFDFNLLVVLKLQTVSCDVVTQNSSVCVCVGGG